jgi:hypothetical protein
MPKNSTGLQHHRLFPKKADTLKLTMFMLKSFKAYIRGLRQSLPDEVSNAVLDVEAASHVWQYRRRQY